MTDKFTESLILLLAGGFILSKVDLSFLKPPVGADLPPPGFRIEPPEVQGPPPVEEPPPVVEPPFEDPFIPDLENLPPPLTGDIPEDVLQQARDEFGESSPLGPLGLPSPFEGAEEVIPGFVAPPLEVFVETILPPVRQAPTLQPLIRDPIEQISSAIVGAEVPIVSGSEAGNIIQVRSIVPEQQAVFGNIIAPTGQLLDKRLISVTQLQDFQTFL